MTTIARMFGWGWEEGGEAWKRRMRLWAWEDDLVVECRNMMSDVLLQVDAYDYWRWNYDSVAEYSVSGPYRLLT